MAATNTTGSPLQDLPEDVLHRVLVGLCLDDHTATAAACKTFRAVIHGPQFLRRRQEYGFAERAIVLVEHERSSVNGIASRSTDSLKVRMAHKSGAASISIGRKMSTSETATDGGARLFVCTDEQTDNAVFVVDVCTRRWSRFATLPQNQQAHTMEWHARCLYVAGGVDASESDFLNSLHAFNEATGLWETLPPMPHACMCATSGVVGNQLFIVGGYSNVDGPEGNWANILQIYDILTRKWRCARSNPYMFSTIPPLAVDGKLFLFTRTLAIYCPRSDTWTEETSDLGTRRVSRACAHNGRIIILYSDGAAFERATDGSSWSPYEAVFGAIGGGDGDMAIFGSVLLG